MPNGRPTTSDGKQQRSASSSIHDRNASGMGAPTHSGPRHSSAASNSPFNHNPANVNSNSAHSHQYPQHANNGSATSAHHLSVSGGIPPFASPYGASPSSASAKESFLNYFFGGSEMSHSGTGGGGSARRSALPDIGAAKGDNPLSGRRGLEGNAAAFDMKSLDKHLEAVSIDFLHPHPSL